VLDGHVLVDAHVHVPVLASVAPAWVDWARRFGPEGILEDAWDADGVPRPARLDELFEEQGVDHALLFCEYSPKATGYQHFEDLLPIVEQNPTRFRPVANVNPHLHFPIAAEVRRQLDLGAAALKLHPVHGGFRCDDATLYPAYQVLAERGVPLIVHCGTSTFPGSMNELADPAYLLPMLRDFPTVDVVLAHGGRGWWYDAAAFMALSNERVWIELAGLPPKRLPHYYRNHALARLAARWIFATDWPGVPGTARNARDVVDLGLSDQLAAAVLGGNARRVYAGLPTEG
jgi:predicted TIM-barrel fold metal-dependent hydrolase